MRCPTPIPEIQEKEPPPKISEGSISRLVNGVSSLVEIERSFNQLRIPELELPTTPEATIKVALSELYQLQEDLQIHLQGGPLADPSTLGIQRRRKVTDLLERVMKDIALYEEFVNRAQHLSLEKILNESDGSSEDEFIDSETLDTESEIHAFEDTLSDVSYKSTTSTTASNIPMSPRISKSYYDSNVSKLRTMSSASLASAKSKASSHFSRSSSPSMLFNEDAAFSTPPEPWDAFRWKPMDKISDHLYSQSVSQSAGLPTVLAVSGVIAIGTTRGLVLVYENPQEILKCILGSTSNAIEYGAVTSLAISSDHSQILSGHSQGYILIWDINKPISPIRTIMPISSGAVAGGKKEGHIHGSAILHVGFVGVRKNGIVSGDNHGLAFFHNLYKVMLFNATETTRIIGRYPVSSSHNEFHVGSKIKRPSTIFGLAPLPFGQLPHGSEGFGLVAILTPYKMIIVSTKPTIHTHYKDLKPKNISTDSSTASKSISGCLAWYPAVKFQLNTETPIEHTDPLLAFSWGNHLTILKITVAQVTQPEHPKSKRKPDFVLEFIKVGQWKARNSIVALQWLSPHILLILTNTEDIVVFDPRYMQESEQNNIRHRSLVYHNHFSSLLIDRSDDSVKNTVDLAYYHSLRIYKSHVYLLGVRNLYVGSLLSWADRILAFVQSGDYLEAIALATSYYNGTTSQTILGLPDNEEIRHMIVGGKLMELLNASINYAFSSERTFAGMADEHNVLFHDLAVACIQACLSMHKEEFLFNDIYERYSNASAKGTLLEVLEPYILDDKMEELPPEIMKDLVTHYRDCRLLTRIEQCIWHINPKYLDIDQVVQLCKNEKLYDALIYVWNRSMDDYVNPAVELLGLIKKVLSLEKRKKKEHRFNGITDHVDSMEEDDLEVLKADARKFYTYMENILTGHTYPNGAPLNEKDANEARTNLYSFIFSGRCIIWPKNGGELILTAEDEAEGREPIYPYLRLFLRFNTKAFLQALEIAFEDSYLNGVEIIMDNDDDYYEEEELPGKIINRQLLINILIEVMTTEPWGSSEFSQSDISQLYCFVAKNLPKYPQFLLLPRNAMQKILAALSLDTDPHTREERQLSVECLLSIYTPQDEDQMVRLYESAGFWRVLENVYKAEQKYGLLLSTYLKDPERRNEVFDCIRELLNPKSHITETQRQEVSQIIMEKIEEIVDIDGGLTAFIVQAFFSGDHKTIISNLSSSPARLFTYLRVLLEPSEDVSKNSEIKFVKTVEEQLIWLETSNSISEPEIHEKYITLMCKFDPTGVYHYLKTHQGAYRLEKILPACISAGIVDSVVWIMEQSGNAIGALDKILEIVQEKRQNILILIEEKKSSKNNNNNNQWTLIEKGKIETALMKLKGVLKIAITLCENSCRRAIVNSGNYNGNRDSNDDDDSGDDNDDDSDKNSIKTYGNGDRDTMTTESESELLWFKLLDTFLDATKAITSSVTPQRPPRLSEKLLSNNTYETPKSPIPTHIADLLITTFKSYVQSILRSLLLSTSSPYVSLPRLLLKFIRSQSRRNSTVADFRDIFIGMIDTYKYESQLLTLTNRLFEKDLFMGVASVVKQRGKGWRPRRGTCEVCGGHFWGTDISLLNHQTKTTVNPKKEQSTTSTIYDSDEIIGIEVLQGSSDQVLTEEEINRYLQILTEEKINTPLQMQTQPQTQSSPPEAALSEIALSEPESTTASTHIQENDLILFRCGHGFHLRCLNSEVDIDNNNDIDNDDNNDNNDQHRQLKCTNCKSERRNSSVSFEIKNQSTENSSFKPFKGKNRLVS